jgi:hypothetical protein
MFQIEKLNDTSFFVKTIGLFPLEVAEKFIEEFEDRIKHIHGNLSVIIDMSDAILLKIESIEIIIKLLERNNARIFRSAFIISGNPPLEEEFRYVIKKAKNPKRKIVSNLKEAKDWISLNEVMIQ